MTRLTLIDSQTAGISGDMLLGALVDAGANPENIQRVLDTIPDHFSKCKSIRLHVGHTETHGFRAQRADLEISENRDETSGKELLHAAEEIARSSQITEKAASFATNSVRVLVEVESRIHGTDVSKLHLHEAGSSDTLADIFGVAVACDSLGVFDGETYATPVAVGGGTLEFSHGTMSSPAPAVLEILRENNAPILGGSQGAELATPTGVSMLVSLARTFLEKYPPMVPEKVGYGAGKRELNNVPNFLRVVIGRPLEYTLDSDTVQVLETNLDDLPAELIGHTLQRLLDSGARDAWVTSALFKKNRLGHVLHAICDPKDTARLAEIVIEETGTLGVRYQNWNRFTLQRELKTIKVNIQGKTFDVRVKLATNRAGKVVRAKPEFDDIESIAQATSMSAREVSDLVSAEAHKLLEKKT